MQLSIVIVSYNTCKLTLQTVRSVMKAIGKKSPLNKTYEIIVIDNDSHDETIKNLKKIKFKNLKVINSGSNLGFGRANNLGFKHATGQYILFLNSDTIVPKGSLEKMVEYYQEKLEDERGKNKRLGMLAAGLLNKDGTIQPQGGDLPNLLTIANTMFFLDDIPYIGKFLPSVQHTGKRFDAKKMRQNDFVKMGWVAGTAVMVEREIWEDSGGWDPEIFMYGEDQEVCYRMQRQKFYHGILNAAPITHLGSASSGSEFALLGEFKGYLYFFRKYRSIQAWSWLKMILWWACMIRILVFTFVKKDEKRVAAYNKALAVVEDARYE